MYFLICVIGLALFSCDGSSGNESREDKTPPQVPSFKEGHVGDGFIQLDWEAVDDDDLAKYLIEQSSDNSTFGLIAEVNASDSSYTVTSLMNGTAYYFRIQSMDLKGNKSNYSATLMKSPIDNIAPDAVTQVTVSYGNGFIKLEWAFVAAADVVSYIVEQSTDAQNFAEVGRVSGSVNEYNVSSLQNGTTYYYRIIAVDGANNESLSSSVYNATPSDGSSEYMLGKDNFLQGNYTQAIQEFSTIIDNDLDTKDKALTGRGWSYLYRADGQSNSSDVDLAIADFNSSLDDNDSKAGMAVVMLLKDDGESSYQSSSSNADAISNLASYQHDFIAKVDQRYIRLHGAFAYFFLNNYEKVKEYLDLVEPSVSHSIDPLDLIADLQRLTDEINNPSTKFIRQKLLRF